METPITISKELVKDSALSFSFLREEAVKSIQQLGGTTWTDHNVHDPGITILEQVCYAITDLAYRLDYDIKDILGNKIAAYNELYSPATILSTNPVTLLDYRKIILDTKGVRNAWIEKVTTLDNSNIKGLYNVAIEFDDVEQGTNVSATVTQKLQAVRGLCEDFEEVNALHKQKINFSGTIEISENVDNSNQLVAQILYCLHWNLSPAITFYTLQELQEKGKRIDEIFDGPTLTHGFIDGDELLKQERKHEIHASDMIKDIMDVENVVTVQNFSISSGTSEKNWFFPLDPSKTPSLDVEATLDALSFQVKGLATNINREQVLAIYKAKIKAFSNKKTLREEQKDILLTIGEDQEIENYHSIQEQFPVNFGIGSTGLPDAASPKRKAQAKQLSGYLTFFDQLLANYFSQVANFHKLVGHSSSDVNTYFNQSLLGKIAGLDELLKDSENYKDYVAGNTVDQLKNLQRKNKFLNHLLARYSETFTAYGMLQQDSKENIEAIEEKLIQDKMAFLNAYPSISAQRGKAFDYTKTADGSIQKSGLEQRIIHKLGAEDEEEFYMVEHLLLRPKESDNVSLQNYYQTNIIESFEPIENIAEGDETLNEEEEGDETTTETESTATKIITPNHFLTKDDRIEIFDNEVSLGIFHPEIVSENEFEIETVIPNTAEETQLTWKRVDPDIRFQVFTDPILSFEVGENKNATLCKTTHSLNIGDQVKIVGTHAYDGVHTIINTSETGFEIAADFQGDSLGGRFSKLTQQTDSYSLQVTFVLPLGKGRYQIPNFKNFVESTLLEETPAHITTHIKWVDTNQMDEFKEAYQKFLVEKSNTN